MGISTTTNRVVYNGDGSSATFGFQYEFFAQADLKVYLYNSSSGLATLQTLNTNYTVGGTPNLQGVYTSGGSIIMASAAPSTHQVVIYRDGSQVQNYTLLQNGNINSVALVQQLDYLTLICQRLQDQATRSIRLSDGYGLTFDPTLPANLNTMANQSIIVNSAANGVTFQLANAQYIPNTVIVAVSSSVIASLGGAPNGYVLTSNGSSAPGWTSPTLVASGILAVTAGGTGTGTIQGLGQSIIAGSGGIYTSDSNFFWSTTNTRLGIGTQVPGARVAVIQNSSFQAPPASTVIHVVGPTNTPTRLVLDAFNSSAIGGAGAVLFRRAQGNGSSPTAAVSDQNLGYLGAAGYGTTAFGTALTGLAMHASQLWTDTNQGTYVTIATTANSSVLSAINLRVDNDGTLFLSKYGTNPGLIYSGSGGVLAAVVSGTSGFIAQSAGAGNPIAWVAPTTGSSAILTVTTKTANYNAATSDDYLIANSSNFTINLYGVSGNSGRKIRIKKTSPSSSNAVTIAGSAATINGNTTAALNTKFEEIELICDGTNWQAERYIPGTWEAFTPTGAFNTNVTWTGQMRRSGDSMDLVYKAAFTGSTNAVANCLLDLPAGYVVDISKTLLSVSTLRTPLNGNGLLDASSAAPLGTALNGTTNFFVHSFNNNAPTGSAILRTTFNNVQPFPLTTGNGFMVVIDRVPIVGWDG